MPKNNSKTIHVELSVSVKLAGASEEAKRRIISNLIDSMQPSREFLAGYNSAREDGAKVISVSVEQVA